MFGSIFRNSHVLVTGHTGFKGRWLCTWLNQLGATVHGFSLASDRENQLFADLGLGAKLATDSRGDIRDIAAVKEVFQKVKPRFVFHLAAQAIVRQSFTEPLETFEANVMGTLNLLEAIRVTTHPTVCVVVSSDKCYENREWLNAYREDDAMGGFDPYSASKGCVEIATASYRRSFFTASSPHRIASARAGNVIGGGDWAKDRIVPDVFRALRNKSPIPIRNKYSTRPWQHVLEPLSGYLWLAANLASPELMNLPQGEVSGSFNFGPSPQSNRTVVEVVDEILKHVSGTWIDASTPNSVHEAGKLNVTIDKAFHLLGWSPTWDFQSAIKKTVDWYTGHARSADSYELTREQILDYSNAAHSLKNAWALR
jgi:CDP-glucose 4,6-dehydratase